MNPDLSTTPSATSSTWIIRTAQSGDAERACDVLRDSIRELCGTDHAGDPEVIAQWLATKTPENVLSWITAPGCRFLVAETGTTILGVAAAARSGEILLNYVAPEARFLGVSKALLRSLEGYIRDGGRTHAKLTSTATAKRVYQTMGYADTGDPVTWGRLTGYAMEKEL
jgi:GNAT superfamily N-acetyltransferase